MLQLKLIAQEHVLDLSYAQMKMTMCVFLLEMGEYFQLAKKKSNALLLDISVWKSGNVPHHTVICMSSTKKLQESTALNSAKSA